MCPVLLVLHHYRFQVPCHDERHSTQNYRRRLDLLSVCISPQRIASNLTRRCSPFKRFGILPLGGRSVAIKLSDGTVWVLASTPPDDQTRKEIDSLGTVTYIVSPNSEHHFFLGRSFREVYKAILNPPRSCFQGGIPPCKACGTCGFSREAKGSQVRCMYVVLLP